MAMLWVVATPLDLLGNRACGLALGPRPLRVVATASQRCSNMSTAASLVGSLVGWRHTALMLDRLIGLVALITERMNLREQLWQTAVQQPHTALMLKVQVELQLMDGMQMTGEPMSGVHMLDASHDA